VRAGSAIALKQLRNKYQQNFEKLFTKREFVSTLNQVEFSILNRLAKFVVTEFIYRQVPENDIRTFLYRIVL
jgi:hypothetical protein